MEKRGQITTFIIVGVVAFIAIVLILFLRNQVGLFVPTQDFLTGVSENIQGSIGECADKYSKDGLKLMLNQGGKINPTNYRLYQGKKVNYLCDDILGDKACMNKLEPLSSWEIDFSKYLKLNLDQCINLESFRSSFKAYDIKYDGYDVDTKFLDDNTVVEIKPKISLVKDGNTIEIKPVVRNYKVPIGTLYKAAFDTINGEAINGEFLNLQYMIAHRGEIEVFIDDKPYPDEIYVANKKNDKINKLYFAIQGEEIAVE